MRKRKFVIFIFCVFSRQEIIRLPLRYDKRIGTVTQQAEWLAQNIADDEGANVDYRVYGSETWVTVVPEVMKLIKDC